MIFKKQVKKHEQKKEEKKLKIIEVRKGAQFFSNCIFNCITSLKLLLSVLVAMLCHFWKYVEYTSKILAIASLTA